MALTSPEKSGHFTISPTEDWNSHFSQLHFNRYNEPLFFVYLGGPDSLIKLPNIPSRDSSPSPLRSKIPSAVIATRTKFSKAQSIRNRPSSVATCTIVLFFNFVAEAVMTKYDGQLMLPGIDSWTSRHASSFGD